MEMWFSDEHTDNVKLSIRVDKQLFSAQSEFQRIDVLESKEFDGPAHRTINVIIQEEK